MTGKKDLNQKSPIREYPSNPCHPYSFLIDEYYFIDQQIQLIQRSRFIGHYRISRVKLYFGNLIYILSNFVLTPS
jgi:hypothetical protein